VHLAHELAADFPDVQLYVNLHGYEPAQRLAPSQVLDRFLRALGVSVDGLPTDLDEQAARYRGLLAGRHALVVLDNAFSADQVRPLLPASPSCLVLITSRDRLAGLVAAEAARVLMLDVLSARESLDLLSRTAGPERVAAEPEAAAEVVRLCGCLPLAVRIAGARLATRPDKSVAALAERLSDEHDRLGELSAGDVGVRASFAPSYGALDPEVARMFRRLGLVPGPDFAPGVAAALVDRTREEGEAALETLVEAHLVEVGPIPGRYRFHDLLRLYAREQAETDDTDQDREEARRRMLEWYLHTADAAERHLAPWRRRLTYQRAVGWPEPIFAGREEALAWFEVELPALVPAVDEAAKYGFHPTAWLLPDALWSFFSLRSYYADWQRTIRIGLAAARKVRNRQAEAWTMTSLAHTQRELFKTDEELLDLYRRSLAIFREVGDPQGEARALHGLGGTYLHIGRLQEAIACQERVLAISQRTNDLYREEVALRHLGWTYRVLRRFDEAIDCHQRSLAISGELGNRLGEGSGLYALGEVYCDLGRFDEALHCAQQSLAINRELGSRGGEGRSLNLLGLALQNTQGIEAARACWHEALHILAELGLPQAEEVRDRLAHAGATLISRSRMQEG
jgi:tetratricopeptide (TPR) repeat protein